MPRDPFLAAEPGRLRRVPPSADGPLRDRLAKDHNGGVLANLRNALLVLAHDPDVAGLFATDDFTGSQLATRAPPPLEARGEAPGGPFPRPVADEDVALVQAHMQRAWAPRFTEATVRQAIGAEAALRRFHPVRLWLSSLRWDGRARLDTWMCRAFGAEDTPYHRGAGAKFLVAAVRRVRRPGAKFDTLPVLEGAQGIGKSRACAALAGPDWFTDAMPADLGGKEAAHSLVGKLVVEWAEIEHLIRLEPETVKAFLSRQVDRYRRPYGRSFVDWPRQCVFVGTTNAEDYLRDATGNRRVWPIRCRFADADWVAAHRDQLWAEAAAREAAGEALWLDLPEAGAAAARAQAERMAEDVWTDRVRELLAMNGALRLPQVLAHLGIPTERQGKREEMRAAAILTREGWRRKLEWSHGRPVRVWRPDAEAGTEPPPDPGDPDPNRI